MLMAEPHSDEVFEYEEVRTLWNPGEKNKPIRFLLHIMPPSFPSQEKKRREEVDPKLRECMDVFSAKDAILEQGVAKSFEQSV